MFWNSEQYGDLFQQQINVLLKYIYICNVDILPHRSKRGEKFYDKCTFNQENTRTDQEEKAKQVTNLKAPPEYIKDWSNVTKITNLKTFSTKIAL